jgi:hypothetical protein
MKVLKDFLPAHLGRTVIFLLAVVFLLVSGGIHSDIYAGDKIMRPISAEIAVNHKNLNYGATEAGGMTTSVTPSQCLYIRNTGGGTLNWVVTDDRGWLYCVPTFGTDSGVVDVSVATCALSPGSYSGTITITDSVDSSVTPQTVTVNLDVKNSSQDAPPFGTFDTPVHGSTVMSSVPVTGWVLDDTGVETVKIWRCSESGFFYIGDTVFVEGPRPDVEQAYPDYPLNYKAGWGYMMLTNFLPNGGNGTYNITAIATDLEGKQTTLGSKTIYCDNEHAVKPFGAIDSPLQGGSASGSSYINWGWALTPQPNYIPTDGSTINVWVDGVNIGHPYYK